MGFQGGDGSLAGFFRGQTKKLTGRIYHRAVKVDDLDTLQVMALPDFEVIRVVCWCHLDGAGAKFRIDILVTDNGNLTVGQWQHNARAN